MLGAEEARLAERLGATRFPRPLLPVIPLGVDAADSRRGWNGGRPGVHDLGLQRKKSLCSMWAGSAGTGKHIRCQCLRHWAVPHEACRSACT